MEKCPGVQNVIVVPRARPHAVPGAVRMRGARARRQGHREGCGGTIALRFSLTQVRSTVLFRGEVM